VGIYSALVLNHLVNNRDRHRCPNSFLDALSFAGQASTVRFAPVGEFSVMSPGTKIPGQVTKMMKTDQMLLLKLGSLVAVHKK
jgi:hypothetical protein